MTTSDSPLRMQLRDLYDDYTGVLDDGNLDAWTAFFTQDCHYRVVSLENYVQNLSLSAVECHGIGSVRDRVAALRETAVFEPRTLRRLVSGVRIMSAQGDVISSQASFAIFESLSDRETHVFLTGRYIDQVVRDDGSLKLRQRVCVFDNYRIRTSLIYPV